MSKQLDLFQQQKKESYEQYYKRFYAHCLRQAEERRQKRKEGEPMLMISLNPESLGKELYFDQNLKLRVKE